MCNRCYQRHMRSRTPTDCPHNNLYAKNRCYSCYSKLLKVRRIAVVCLLISLVEADPKASQASGGLKLEVL